MASKRRVRRKQCAGKRKYDRREKAVASMIGLTRTGERNLNTYFCKFCKRWHVGHRIGSFGK